METIKFYQGQENGVVNESVLQKESIFIKQYKHAANLLTEYVGSMNKLNDDGVGLEVQTPNIIAFCGDRGEGKTSCMYSILNSIKQHELFKLVDDKDEKAKKLLQETDFYCLPIVDPAFFDHNHNILELVIGQMYQIYIKENNNHDGKGQQGSQELEKKFQNTKTCLKHLDSAKHEMYDVLEELDALAEGINLRKVISELFDEFCKYMGRKFLIISIDDLDLNMNEAYIMAEQLRKYMNNNRCIIFISVKVDQLREVVENTIGAELGDGSRIDTREMAAKYVEKLLPQGIRINMPKVYDLCDSPLDIYQGDTLLGNYPTVRDCVVRLIFTKTRFLFYNKKNYTSPIVPNNLRSLRHLIGMLMDMPDFINNQTSLDNKKIFLDYFYYTWTKTLNVNYQRLALLLVHNENLIQTNKLIIDFLQPLIKSSPDAKNSDVSNLIRYITNPLNYGFNQSTGDVFLLLNILERNSSDEDVQNLIFFIKSFYSIRLYQCYDAITEGSNNENGKEDAGQGEFFKYDKWFNEANTLQQLINGSFFTYNPGDMLAKSSDNNSARDCAIIYGDKLKQLVTKVKDRLSNKKVEVNIDFDDDFKTSFKILEFVLLNLTRRVASNVISLKDDKFRTELTPVYLTGFNTQMGYFMFDILGSFANIVNIKFAYNRFGLDFFTHALKYDWSLLNSMLVCVLTKEAKEDKEYHKHDINLAEIQEEVNQKMKQDEQKRNVLHRLISNAIIRNAEILSSMRENMLYQKESIRSSGVRKELLREFYSKIMNTNMRTYQKNPGSSHYVIQFAYLEAFRDFLKEVSNDDLEILFTKTITNEDVEIQAINTLFSDVLEKINSWRTGKSIKAEIAKIPQIFNLLTEGQWNEAFPDYDRFTKETLVNKLRSIHVWTL